MGKLAGGGNVGRERKDSQLGVLKISSSSGSMANSEVGGREKSDQTGEWTARL